MRPGFVLTPTVVARNKRTHLLSSVLLIFSLVLSSPAPVWAEVVREKAPAAEVVVGSPEFIQQAFLKGKTLYDAGDVEAALKAWTALDPYLNAYPSVRQVIEYLKAKAQSPEAPPPPMPDISSVLEKAADQMRARREEAEAAQQKASSGKRQDWVKEAFEKGRQAYAEGDFATAIEQWEKMSSYLDESAPERRTVESLKREYFASEKLRTETQKILGSVKQKYVAPPDLIQTLEEAKAKLRAESAKMSSEMSAAGKARAEREAWVDAALVRARAAYEEGRISPAIDEWEKTLPFLEGEDVLREKIKTLREDLRSLADVKAQNENAAAEAFEKLKVPLGDRLSAEIARATDILRTKEGRSIEQQKELEKSLAERQEWIAAQFEKGKQFLNDGRVLDAIAQWESILPNIEGAEELRSGFDHLKQQVKETEAIQKTAAEKSSMGKLKAPAELADLLDKASKTLTDHRTRAESQRKEIEGQSAKQQKEINEVFDRGKDFYVQGKYWEAAEAWKALIPMVEEATQVEKWIHQFEAAYRDYLDSKSSVDRMSEERSRKFAAPADILKLLMQAQKDIEAQTASLVAERASMEKGTAEHAAWAKDTFEKGKTLYAQGHVDLAVAEWEKLVPHLDEASPERSLILDLRKQRDQARSSQARIEDLSQAKQGRLQAPSDLKIALESAIDTTRAKQRELELEEQAVNRSINERRDAMLEILQNGKTLFEAGQAKEAVEEWEKLSQYVDARSGLQDTLKQLKDAFNRQKEAKQTLAETQARGGSRFEPPQELAVALQQVSDTLSAAASRARAEKADLEKAYTDKKIWLDQTVQTGKQFYTAGRLEDAVDEWSKLTPYLPEESGLPQKLSDLKNIKEEAVRAKKEAVEAVAQQYKGLRVEPQMAAFLSDISKDLRTQTVQSEKDRGQAQAQLTENQKKVDAILKEGKTLYDAGDLGAAVVSWSALLPYLDETSGARRTLTELRQRFDDLGRAKKASAEAQKQAAAGVELPVEFSKLAAEAKKQLESEQAIALDQLRKAQSLRTDREKKVAASYESAKTKFWNGDFAGAIEGWKALAPDVTGAPAVVQSLESDWAQAQKAKAAASEAEKQAQAPLAPPADFVKEAEAARQKIRADMDAMLAQKTQSEGNRAARQAALTQTFEQGKTLYWSGKISEALAKWKEVVSSVSDPEAGKSYEELQKAYAKMTQAQTAAGEAATTAAAKLDIPAELPKLLALAVEKTNAQTQAALAEKAKLSEDLASRRAYAEEAFQKGAAAIQAGKYADGIQQWRLIVPMTDAEAGLGPALDSLEKAMIEADTARQETDAYAAGEFKDIRFSHGNEIIQMIQQTGDKLKAQAADARQRRTEMEKTIGDRQAWVEATFQKGKELFEKGQYAEAEEFWKSLGPYLVDGPQTLSMIEEFSKIHAEAAAAVADAVDAESKKDTRFPTPQDLPKLLAEATEKIKSVQFEARTRRERVEQSLSDRRVAIQAAFDQGKAIYEKGSVPLALDEWSKMLPMVEDEAKTKEALDAIRVAYQQSVEAKKAAEDAESRKDSRLAIPPDLQTTLTSVAEKLKKEIQSSDLQREKMEKTLADRQAFVRDLFQRGKALYDEGKLQEAFDLWKTIGPYVEDEEKLNELLSKAGQVYQSFVSAKSANHEAILKQATKLPAPSDLMAILDTAIEKIKQDDFDSRGKTFEIEKSISDRREWILSEFKKGQALYIEGRIPEAVAEWNTILPYLEDGLEVKAKLVEIEKNATLAEKSRRILEASQEKARIQFQSPKELNELLLKANDDLKNQMFAASSEKAKAEQTLTDRQKWLSQTFDLGRSFYAEGKISEALSEWVKLKPYLEGEPAIQEMMDTLKKSYEDLQQAKKSAVEAAAEDYKGLRLTYSDQMSKILQEAVKKVSDETLALREKLEKTHETLSERKEWSLTTFNKGKVLYEDGRYAEAIEQWKRLLPYLEKDSEIKVLIESFQKSFEEWTDRSAAIGELEKRTETPVQMAQPETMAVTLKEAADRMKNQAMAATTKAADLEKSLDQRKSWIEFTFAKGKKLFDEGHYADAVNEWGVLGPYLSEHPDVREQIEEAKRSYVQFRKADQILKNAETKKAGLLPLPEGAVMPPVKEETAPVAEPSAPAPVEAPASPAAPVSVAANTQPAAPETKAVAPETPSEPAAAPATAPAADTSSTLLSGEVTSFDQTTSTLHLRLFSDSSERTIHYDGATQFDGEAKAGAGSLQNGASVDVRVDSQDRASYIYLY